MKRKNNDIITINISTERGRIVKELEKAGITTKRLTKIKETLPFLKLCKELSKLDKKEQLELSILKYYYKIEAENNLHLIKKILKLHNRLLNSKNIEIKLGAIKEADKLIWKYKPDEQDPVITVPKKEVEASRKRIKKREEEKKRNLII